MKTLLDFSLSKNERYVNIQRNINQILKCKPEWRKNLETSLKGSQKCWSRNRSRDPIHDAKKKNFVVTRSKELCMCLRNNHTNLRTNLPLEL